MTTRRGDGVTGDDGDGSEFDEVDLGVLDAAVAESVTEVAGDYDDRAGVGSVDLATGEIGSSGGPGPGTRTSLSDQLAGAVPVVLLARSHQLSNQIPGLARIAARSTRGRAGVGVVVRLPSMTATSAQAYFDRCPNDTLLLADPDLHLAQQSGSPDALPPSTRKAAQHPWFASAPAHSDAVDSGWVAGVLDRQRQAGATALMSATGWVDGANGAPQLVSAMRWVAASRTAAGGSPMFVNLTFDHSWLTKPALRNLLLTELVESDEPLWYLRFRWPIVDPRYGQVSKRDILSGYRELARAADLEGKRLILPNSGLTGWVMTALGASGFSTGPSWPEQAYAEQRRMGATPGRQKPPPTIRYYERTILHTIDHSSHLAMSGTPGYAACTCRYCQSLHVGTPNTAQWSKEVASLHYLLSTARLTGKLASPSKRAVAFREVQRARAFIAGLAGSPAAPTGNNAASHLPEWENVLA